VIMSSSAPRDGHGERRADGQPLWREAEPADLGKLNSRSASRPSAIRRAQPPVSAGVEDFLGRPDSISHPWWCHRGSCMRRPCGHAPNAVAGEQPDPHVHVGGLHPPSCRTSRRVRAGAVQDHRWLLNEGGVAAGVEALPSAPDTAHGGTTARAWGRRPDRRSAHRTAGPASRTCPSDPARWIASCIAAPASGNR